MNSHGPTVGPSQKMGIFFSGPTKK
uniref:Uncharacterized protein n=1 Tax=Rhizophora mucronata TaxID=61149 RepID=A0A2P2N803_RHIMU